MSEKIVCTRFAPSPTGYMHIGNLRTALYAYLLAKSNNGRFIVRIEDTDQERLVAGAMDVILDTLKLTGLDYDEGPGVGGNHGPYIQSQRKEIYIQYAKKLVELDKAYYCFCQKERLEKMHEENPDIGYDRHCRDLTPEEIKKHLDAKEPYVIRQKVPLTGTTTYIDENYGEISIENKELQDQILLKTDGYPTYNFAHVVDDHLMEVTHVVRGSEYLTSTPKYVLLYDAFGWERPRYVHLPLLNGRDENGKISKLSKRHGAVSFMDLLNEGYLPEAIINYIAFLGWSPSGMSELDENEEILSLDELTQRFSIDGLSKSPAVFDYDKLKWFNSVYIKRMSIDKFAELTVPKLKSVCPDYVNCMQLVMLLHTRVSTLNEAVDMADFVCERLPFDRTLYNNKKNKTDPETCKDILKCVLPVIMNCSEWTNNYLYDMFKEYCENSTYKIGALLWAIRIAVARKKITPGGATELMVVLGKEESISRIEQAIDELEKS